MRIEKDIYGWRVEPDTKEEEIALEIIFKAFTREYCGTVITSVYEARRLFP